MSLQVVGAAPIRMSAMGSSESPALPKKRARMAAFSDDDEDEFLDVPLDKRPAPQQPPPQQIQGLEDEEGEDDDWEDVQEVAVPTEPAMKRKIERDQSCELSE